MKSFYKIVGLKEYYDKYGNNYGKNTVVLVDILDFNDEIKK